MKPAGSSCNDGIYCTQNDLCSVNGTCAGMQTASCSGTIDCANNMSPMPSTIDVPLGAVSGSITMGGQALPAMSFYGGATFYLKAKDTKAMHSVASYTYSGANNTLYGPFSSNATHSTSIPFCQFSARESFVNPHPLPKQQSLSPP